ncbi:class I SAM-dependent rRNA methyltransferase [Tahibacter amnicola]|uniref:Class I SAM-dependent rRNA methyltransferase n=1 Tax=Tahibacter amnicola TaxID=2976241 RepID=A0ABY6BD44_9GAMM|nr:class I SAM-dependent rRNA methyltransferase [Tahibacter amnicola]UXI67138.1 class I SAM-dependent rRNA methyltransferase [Tahibacter amnicola]
MSDAAEYPALVLKRGEDARLRAGHLWVFSNEVDVKRTPLTAFEPGEIAVILDAAAKPIGVGYVNPNSLICARLVSRGLDHALDRSLIVHRLNVALSLRERLYSEPYYRLVYGESDGLPGLTLDRFGDVIVGQTTTAGMERLKDEITEAVVKALKPQALVWKNDAGIRSLEHLPEYADIGYGELRSPMIVREGGLEFECDPIGGQKTGWFYDQHANRDRLAQYVRGKRVLDVCSYLGGWGLRAAAMGASEVVCVDVSAHAVEQIRRNIDRNNLGDRVTAVKADAFDELKRLREERSRFDVVILDPPAFVKRKKDFAEGRIAYRRLNEMAMQILTRDAILVTCSCSYHMPRNALLDSVQQAARHLDRNVQVLEQLQQSPDHPVHPAIAETEYLKGFICRVLPA